MDNIAHGKEMTAEGDNARPCSCCWRHRKWYYRDQIGITLLRICVAGMILMHGVPKLIMLVQGEGPTWLDPLGIGGTTSLLLCVFAEFLCALGVLLGLFTRFCALVLAANFWVIVFIYDADIRPMQAELPLLYFVCFITLVCTGGGKWSLDALMCRHHYCHMDIGRKKRDKDA